MNTYKGLISKRAACLATVSVVYQLVRFSIIDVFGLIYNAYGKTSNSQTEKTDQKTESRITYQYFIIQRINVRIQNCDISNGFISLQTTVSIKSLVH